MRCEFTGSTGAVQKILALYEGDASPAAKPPPARVGALGRVGNRTLDALREGQQFFAFVGGMTLAVGGVLRRPRTGNWHDIAPIMTRTGADAVPIVVLITFLIGFVMAFQSAVQLKQFGANIYVADLVALLADAGFGGIRIAPKDTSREYIQHWAPGRGVENFIASANIEAIKPVEHA